MDCHIINVAVESFAFCDEIYYIYIYIYKYVTDHVNKTNQTKKQEQHRNNTNETPSCIKGPATSSADKVQLPEMSCSSLVS